MEIGWTVWGTLWTHPCDAQPRHPCLEPKVGALRRSPRQFNLPPQHSRHHIPHFGWQIKRKVKIKRIKAFWLILSFWAVAVAVAYLLILDNASEDKCSWRVCGGLVCLTGVSENRDVFIKRAMDGLAKSRRPETKRPQTGEPVLRAIVSNSTYPSEIILAFKIIYDTVHYAHVPHQ